MERASATFVVAAALRSEDLLGITSNSWDASDAGGTGTLASAIRYVHRFATHAIRPILWALSVWTCCTSEMECSINFDESNSFRVIPRRPKR